MPGIDTPDQNSIPPTHEDFRWIFGPGKNQRFATYIELTRDVTAGVASSLQVIYSSELIREMNLDAEPEQATAPALGKTDSANLLRLSLAAVTMLRDLSDAHIQRLNEWDEQQA